MFGRFPLLVVVLYYLVFNSEVSCSDQFFIKSASPKKIPLIGKRNKNNSNVDFEKFFLKASKSVPRIGRTENALKQVKDLCLWIHLRFLIGVQFVRGILMG